jgi:hypothetical protein
MIRIREASNHEELEAIFGFRYRIYVDEMGRPQKDADHDRRRIRDALDDTAFNLAAWNDERIVGSPGSTSPATAASGCTRLSTR